MASRPPELPESIILGNFSGVRNTVSPERLQPGELEAAVNVDIDDVGQVRRRRGYTRLHAGDHHSLITIDSRNFVVRDGVLGTLDSSNTFAALVSVGSDPLSYTSVGSDIFISSRSFSGKIVAGVAEDWGERGGAGQWISPVMRPTETLGAVAGRHLSSPPLATEIEHYKGRIYLASERWLWATELYLYDHVDKTRNFLQFEHDMTMLAAVEDGLYVGTTEQLFFLSGTLSKGFVRTAVLDAGVIRGSKVIVPTSKIHPEARNGPVPEGNSPVFLTTKGICVGLEGGRAYNLTQDRTQFPSTDRAAALYREDQGASSYIAAMSSSGGYGANARIGDYVDAEIVRAP